MLSNTSHPTTLSQIIPVLVKAGVAYDMSSAIAQQVLAWTQGQPELTEWLLENVIHELSSQNIESATYSTDERSPRELVNAQVNAYFSPNLLKSKAAEPRSIMRLLSTIAEVLQADKAQGGRLLQCYQTVLLAPHQTLPSYQQEQEILSNLGLLRQNDRGQIKVANPVYRRIFNADWVAQQLGQPLVMQKGHWLLLTSLLSILAFILLQSVFRYTPASATHRCNEAADLRNAVLAKLSLDPQQMKQSIDQLLTLKGQDQLSEQCQGILHDLQYSYGIYVAAGTHNHPLDAVTYLCQIPESYYIERNSVPWFSRWSNIYRSTDFSQALTTYVANNPCPGYTFLTRAGS